MKILNKKLEKVCPSNAIKFSISYKFKNSSDQELSRSRPSNLKISSKPLKSSKSQNKVEIHQRCKNQLTLKPLNPTSSSRQIQDQTADKIHFHTYLGFSL